MPYIKAYKSTLYSREWLYQRYVVENLNASQVARLAGCDNSAVLNWLRRFKIPIKTSGEAQRVADHPRGSSAPRPRRKFRGTIQDPQWLRDCYVRDDMNLAEVAEKADCSAQSVRQALEKFGVKLKSMSEAKRGRPNIKKRTDPNDIQESTRRTVCRKYARELLGPGPCVLCDCVDRIDVNHRDRDWANNDENNLERLCKSCHMSQHAEEMWVAFEWLERYGIPYIDLHREARRRIVRPHFQPQVLPSLLTDYIEEDG